MTMQLCLVEDRRFVEQPGFVGNCEVTLQLGDRFPEGEMLGKLHQANQVTAVLTAVAVEQIVTALT